MEFPDVLPDGFQGAVGSLVDSWAKAVHEQFLADQYTAKRNDLLQSIGGDQLQASADDQRKLDEMQRSIDASTKERDRLLSAGLQSIAEALHQFPLLAVTTSL